jgi:hypothetical protein
LVADLDVEAAGDRALARVRHHEAVPHLEAAAEHVARELPRHRQINGDLVPGRGGVADLGGDEHAVARRVHPFLLPAAAAEHEVLVQVEAARLGDAAVEDLELVEDLRPRAGAGNEQGEGQQGEAAHGRGPAEARCPSTPRRPIPRAFAHVPALKGWWESSARLRGARALGTLSPCSTSRPPSARSARRSCGA